ncbi:MAG: biliverdin-producing heme oxygenase [Ahrensia sp.]|nr:biliverdin-producing heme oxygenase [Ahrensia sp.]
MFASSSGYAKWLSVMASVHGRYADCWDYASRELGLEAISHRIGAAIERDCSQLALAQDQAPQLALSPRSLEHALGCAYVLEGSGLGARLLLRQASAENISPTFYLTALEKLSRTRWPSFVDGLDGMPLRIDETAEAARGVFSFLLDRIGRRVS